MDGYPVSIATAITRTIKRLMVQIKGVPPGVDWLPKLYDGLSKEFGRVNDYRRLVERSTVPHEGMPPESADDYEQKYGVENYGALSDGERIARIIERAQGNGNGGPDFLQDVLHQAGFALYVLANPKLASSGLQYGGGVQYGGFVQYGLSRSRTPPATIDGQLITSSPARKGGRPYASQYGGGQYGAMQYGTLDYLVSNPRPVRPIFPADTIYWIRFIVLSPFADRFAGPGELLTITAEEWRYLQKLVITTKYSRDWCIAQIQISG